MGANLWFGDRGMVEEVIEDCGNCHQRKATGRDGLCTECRAVSTQRAGSPPVFYNPAIVKAEPAPEE